MIDAFTFSPCQTESSSHGTFFLLEDLKKALDARDFPSILELKLQKAHWDWEDLIGVYNDCLDPLIDKNEADSNAFVIGASQILFSDLSCRDLFLDCLLQGACSSGNIELALRVKDLFPEWWGNLRTEELAFAMDYLFHSMPEDNFQMRQAGKKEVYYLLTSHSKWAPDSDTLPDLFPYLLNPNKMSVEKNELNQLACSFLKVQSLENVNVGLLAEVVKVVIRKENGDFLKVLTALPNWNKIPPYSYASILEQTFEHCSQNELDFFLAHPSWHKIPPNALRKLAIHFIDCGWVINLLAQNSRWRELSSNDLIRLATHNFISPEAIDLITSHPAWDLISREDLADLIGSIGNHISENTWNLFLKALEHPCWKELTSKELSEIKYWLLPYGNLREPFLERLKEHKNWKD